MIKVILSQQGYPRTEVLVEPTTSIRDIVNNNDMDLTGCTVSLDGIPLMASEFGKSLESFSIASGSTTRLTAVVKSDSGVL
jgi:hypothetical protein